MGFCREHIVKPLTRSNGWSRVRREHLKKQPTCQACGTKRNLEVHHVKDFSNHPELELDPNNLITLCAAGSRCHMSWGHCGNYQLINEHVEEDARYQLNRFDEIRKNQQ